MNLEGLQIFSHEVSGYKPQVDFNTWRVALLNASDMYLPNNITYLTTILKQTKSSFSFQEAVRCFLQAMMKSHTIQYATGSKKGKYTMSNLAHGIRFL